MPMNAKEKEAFDLGRGIEAEYAELRRNASKNRSKPLGVFDLSVLAKERDKAIAEIDRKANEAKAVIERDYRIAIAKITEDLKHACSEIKRSDRLKNKKPKVSRSEAKSKVRSQKITAKSLDERLKFFDGNCAYCGEFLGKNKQIDHVVPISKLGADTLENIVYVCHSCNTSKGNRDFLDWYRSKSFWTQEREDKVISITGRLDALKP